MMPRKGPMTVPAPTKPKMVYGTWPPSPPPVAKQTTKAFNSIKPQPAATRDYGKQLATDIAEPDYS